jgi:predicted acyl esterase
MLRQGTWDSFKPYTPPALEAIFPYDACGAYGGIMGFRESHPGGVIQTMLYHIGLFSTIHENRGVPADLPPELESLWEKAMKNPDYMMYAHLYNILTQKGQRDAMMFYPLVFPFDTEENTIQTEEMFKKIKIPFYTGAGAYAYTYKMHWQGAQHWFLNVDGPKKLIFTGPAHLERPYHEYHDEILRWHDYWLKGVDTGIMDEPPVKTWVMGANKWRYAADWPLPETEWTKYYLHSWERLKREAHLPAWQTYANAQPDAFVQMPPTQSSRIERLRYMTDPLPEDTLVIGPISLTLYASIDQDDTNWIVILKDVGPDVSVRAARPGERSVPDNIMSAAARLCSIRFTIMPNTRRTSYYPLYQSGKQEAGSTGRHYQEENAVKYRYRLPGHEYTEGGFAFGACKPGDLKLGFGMNKVTNRGKDIVIGYL